MGKPPPTIRTIPEAARDAQRLIRPVREQIIDLLRWLVQTDSVAVPPEGNESAAQKLLHKTLRAAGIGAELYDTAFLLRSRHPYVRRDRHYRRRPNLIARLSGTGRGRSLLFTGHVDTVPPGPNPWRDGPFSGVIRAGRLYGRGSYDMKGGLAAHFGVALALRHAGLRLGGDLLFESVVDEESAGVGGTLAGRLRGDRADACIITEGTDLAVFRATRGGLFLDLEVRAGDPARYFSSRQVVSPAIAIGRLLGWVDQWARLRGRRVRTGPYKDFAVPTPVQVLAVEANRAGPDVPWSVPLAGKLRVYFQFLPDEDVPAVRRQIEKSLAEFSRKDPFLRAHPPAVRPLVDPPLLGHELPADHPLTNCLAASARAVLGTPPVVSAAPYPCDAFLIQREFGIPTLLFGPSGAGAHNADECVDVRSVILTAQTLLAAALQWCSVP